MLKPGSYFSFSRVLFRFLMLETAQQLMECTTTSVTTSSTPPTKATWGKNKRAHTHTLLYNYLPKSCFLMLSDVSFCSTLLMFLWLYLLLSPSVAPSHHPSPSLTTLTLPTVPAVSVCALSLNAVSDTICCLSICQCLCANHCPAGEAVDLANKQSFVRLAQLSLTFCQVLITCDTSYLLLGWWIASDSSLRLAWPSEGQLGYTCW